MTETSVTPVSRPLPCRRAEMTPSMMPATIARTYCVTISRSVAGSRARITSITGCARTRTNSRSRPAHIAEIDQELLRGSGCPGRACRRRSATCSSGIRRVADDVGDRVARREPDQEEVDNDNNEDDRYELREASKCERGDRAGRHNSYDLYSCDGTDSEMLDGPRSFMPPNSAAHARQNVSFGK